MQSAQERCILILPFCRYAAVSRIPSSTSFFALRTVYLPRRRSAAINEAADGSTTTYSIGSPPASASTASQ